VRVLVRRAHSANLTLPAFLIVYRLMTLFEMRDWLLSSIDGLGFQTGVVYRDVVKRCLTGDFGISEGDDGALLSRIFFLKVILELASCKA